MLRFFIVKSAIIGNNQTDDLIYTNSFDEYGTTTGYFMAYNLRRKLTTVTTLTGTLVLLLAHITFGRASYASGECSDTIARVVSVQGTVELQRTQETGWQSVEIETQVCAGDRIRVRHHSRAALRLVNDSMLRLDQKTTVTFPASQENQSLSIMDLINGAIHIITRTPRPFKVNTPFMNAGVEGTEFYVRVDQHNTEIVVYEGRVTATNQYGRIMLADLEKAVAVKNQPPRKTIIINPINAVQWTLHYPMIIEYWLADNSNKSSIAHGIAKSARLLAVGSINEAQAAIAKVLETEPDNSDAYALQAIIALNLNNTATASELAKLALELDQASAAAKLAYSYVQQAHFEIEEALATMLEAITLDSNNVLLKARLAELQMSDNQLDEALETAKVAVRQNPAIPRTQTILGFAYLTKMKISKAKAAFTEAIKLDQSDPMPRLGLGLALIRKGHLETGRIELEIAASLDPASSLIRSYLGKAYFEERRYTLSDQQFGMAKTRDPNDPTPWLYDAIQKQTQNQPIEALRSIQKSIDLNDNRAVYRSRLLLDQDEAARGSSLSRIYDNLGFEKRAIMQTAQSLSLDPSNHSAHRFLSDIYVNIPRHEIARVSELLQAQLMQPINTNPVQPNLAVADLNIITNTGPTVVGFNEFAPLMERERPQFVASGIVGSHSTFGNEIVFSQLHDKTSISLGQFHYQSNGFRPNNSQNHDVLNAFIQHAFTPEFNVQAEVRTRDTEHGDLLLDFNPKVFNPGFSRKIQEDVARIGTKYELTADQDLIVSGKYINRSEHLNSSRLDNEGFQFEAQHLWRHENLNTVLGGGVYEFDQVFETANNNRSSGQLNRENIYIYTNLNYFRNLDLTLGVSYDAFSYTIDNLKKDVVNPKFGLQWNIVKNLRLRGAYFETSKSHLIAQQTLEPTQIAGFNQFFDDINGSITQRMGIGLDYHYSHVLYGGVEASKRIVRVPQLLLFVDPFFQKQREQLYRSYLYWTPHKYWAVKGEFKFEQFKRNPTDPSLLAEEPTRIRTFNVPVSVEYFHPSGFFSGLTGTFVRQNLTRLSDFGNENQRSPRATRSGIDSFFLLDAFIGFRLPNRRGIISLEGKNLLDSDFYFRNINFYQSEAVAPRFIPDRTIFARLTLNF